MSDLIITPMTALRAEVEEIRKFAYLYIYIYISRLTPRKAFECRGVITPLPYMYLILFGTDDGVKGRGAFAWNVVLLRDDRAKLLSGSLLKPF